MERFSMTSPRFFSDAIRLSINFEDNTDEYEPEARTILPRLRTCANSDEVVAVVFEEFQKWFGPQIAGGKERYSSLSKEIWLLWNKTRIRSKSE